MANFIILLFIGLGLLITLPAIQGHVLVLPKTGILDNSLETKERQPIPQNGSLKHGDNDDSITSRKDHDAFSDNDLSGIMQNNNNMSQNSSFSMRQWSVDERENIDGQNKSIHPSALVRSQIDSDALHIADTFNNSDTVNNVGVKSDNDLTHTESDDDLTEIFTSHRTVDEYTNKVNEEERVENANTSNQSENMLPLKPKSGRDDFQYKPLQSDINIGPSDIISQNSTSHTTDSLDVDASSTNVTGLGSDTAHVTGLGTDTAHLNDLGTDTAHFNDLGTDTAHVTGLDNDTAHVTGLGNDTAHVTDLDNDTAHVTGLGNDTAHVTGLGNDTAKVFDFANGTVNETESEFIQEMLAALKVLIENHKQCKAKTDHSMEQLHNITSDIQGDLDTEEDNETHRTLKEIIDKVNGIMHLGSDCHDTIEETGEHDELVLVGHTHLATPHQPTDQINKTEFGNVIKVVTVTENQSQSIQEMLDELTTIIEHGKQCNVNSDNNVDPSPLSGTDHKEDHDGPFDLENEKEVTDSITEMFRKLDKINFIASRCHQNKNETNENGHANQTDHESTDQYDISGDNKFDDDFDWTVYDYYPKQVKRKADSDSDDEDVSTNQDKDNGDGTPCCMSRESILSQLDRRITSLEDDINNVTSESDSQLYNANQDIVDLKEEIVQLKRTSAFSTSVNLDLGQIKDYKITVNVNGWFDHSNGVFTVPLSGVYHVFVNPCQQITNVHTSIQVKVSGHPDSVIIFTNGNWSQSLTTLVHLTAGQTLWIEAISDDTDNESDVLNEIVTFGAFKVA